MKKKQEGFTLLELMVVLAIIALLAALITPNVIQKIQVGKQIGTMQDMDTIAKACLEYVVEHNAAPASGTQNGPLSPGNEFIKALTEKYLTSCPATDKWKNPMIVYSGKAVASFPGFHESMVSNSDFIIISYGRKGVDEHFTFDPSNREAGLFEPNTMADYDKNLINWNGAWIRAPRS
jgi:prepilin-type N-terminal cleavage/methylation domain-containing protein